MGGAGAAAAAAPAASEAAATATPGIATAAAAELRQNPAGPESLNHCCYFIKWPACLVGWEWDGGGGGGGGGGEEGGFSKHPVELEELMRRKIRSSFLSSTLQSSWNFSSHLRRKKHFHTCSACVSSADIFFTATGGQSETHSARSRFMISSPC